MEYPKSEIFETLADIEHQRWSDWQKYLHSKCVKSDFFTNKTGNQKSEGIALTIPPKLVKQWEKQIKTDYKDLTEEEKDSDRKEVMRYWNLINKK